MARTRSSPSRRVSDQGLVEKQLPKEETTKRRRTIGGTKPLTPANHKQNPPTSQPKKKQTPHRLHLGSAADYYFSDKPAATPGRSTTKKQPTPSRTVGPTPPTPNDKKEEEPVDDKMDETTEPPNYLNDASMLSTSSDGSDLLNKSVLSDTTELTASNFVLQATSRQRMLELAQHPSKSQREASQEENEEAGTTRTNRTTTTPSKGLEKKSEALLTKSKSPLPSPYNGQSPAHLRHLTDSIRKAKQEQRATRRSSTPRLSVSQEAVDTHDTTLGALLHDIDNQTKEDVASPANTHKTQPNDGVSPSSTLASSNTSPLPESPNEKTPRSSPVSRLAPSSSSKKTKLTPTKLTASPRRIVNPASVDSPARRTRSATRHKSPSHQSLDTSALQEQLDALVASPLEEATSQPNKRPADETEVVETVALSSSSGQQTGGRVSDITLGTLLQEVDDEDDKFTTHSRRRSSKRRKSSIGTIHSTSTADTDDVNMLQELDGSQEEAAPTTTTTLAAASPAVSKMPPRRSILNSSHQRLSQGSSSQPRKAVAFGSPEAAEYHIGSPSMSLTPMPKGEAKQLYTIPNTHSSGETTESSLGSLLADDLDPKTVEMEADLSALLDNTNGAQPHQDQVDPVKEPASDSPPTSRSTSLSLTGAETAEIAQALSELAKEERAPSEEDVTVELEGNLEDLLNQTQDSADPFLLEESVAKPGQEEARSPSILGANTAQPDIATATNPHGAPPEEDVTVELEGNLQDLLNQTQDSTAPSPLLRPSTENTEASPADSIDMADAESVKTFLSQPSSAGGDGTARMASNAQKLQFPSPDSTDDSSSQEIPTQLIDEDNTIELEGNLSQLLATATGGGTAAREAPVPSRLSDKFPKMTSTLAPYTARMSFGGLEDLTTDTALQPVAEDTTLHSSTEGGITKELEGDLESLLKATESRSAVKARLSVTPSESRRRSRHRFSLTPSSRLSVDGGSVVMMDSSTLMEEDNVIAERSDNKMAEEQKEETLDLTSVEIREAALLDNSNQMTHERDADAVVDATRLSRDLNNSLLSGSLADFAHAVCGEVEAKASVSSDVDSCFHTLVDLHPAEMLQLQRVLRHGDDESQTKKQLQKLAEATQNFVKFEWMTWEAMVAESLSSSIENIPAEFIEDRDRLQDNVNFVESAREALSFMEGQAARRARRKSLTRRKVVSSSLEEEIREIESQIARLSENLEAARMEEASAFTTKTAILDFDRTEKELGTSRTLAESSQNKFLSLNGLHCWTPLSIHESGVSVVFVGASPKTCLKISYSVAKSGTVKCEAQVHASSFRQRRGKKLKHTPSVVEYLEANVKKVVDAVNSSLLSSSSEIAACLQRTELAIGRIETNANEIFLIQKKHENALEVDPNGSHTDFLFSVQLGSKSKQVRAIFELSSLYPFSPLNMSLEDDEGTTNVDGLKRQLTKSAKPGFGYLSRTCDTISAFLR